MRLIDYIKINKVFSFVYSLIMMKCVFTGNFSINHILVYMQYACNKLSISQLIYRVDDCFLTKYIPFTDSLGSTGRLDKQLFFYCYQIC